MLRVLGPISAPCLSVHCKDWGVSVSLVMLIGDCLAHFSGVQGLINFFYPGTLGDLWCQGSNRGQLHAGPMSSLLF